MRHLPYLRQAPLKASNTLGIAVSANFFCEIETEQQLKTVLEDPPCEPIMVLGEGSNVVFLKDYSGLLLLNRMKGIQLIDSDSENVWVRVAAGENWDQWVAYSLDQGWFGLENLSGIPGTVGASPIQNIGAYGVELKDCLSAVEAIDLTTGERLRFSLAECEFAYRDSVFKHQLKNRVFITAVEFILKTQPDLQLDYGEIRHEIFAQGMCEKSLTPTQLRTLIISIRNRKLPNPKCLPNAGSFFKNPIVSDEEFKQLKQQFPDLVAFPLPDGSVKLAAGWMIDKLGWKGRGIGDAYVHEKQALVLINNSDSSAELVALYKAIQKDVLEHFSVLLEVEPNII